MEFALCNEVVKEMPLPEQCRFAAQLGYAGLEIAPFTLAEDPTRMTSRQIAETRRIVEDHGLRVTGLHWLLIAPEGLSITDSAADMRQRTADALATLVDLCAELGGRVLVHGSPKQRRLGDDPARARATALAHLAAAGARARAAGITYCIEPLSADESDFINTVAEAAALVHEANEPGLRTMIDTGHALRGEGETLADLAARWLPTGLIEHVQFNDSNRRGPGQGEDRFGPLMAQLVAAKWAHPLAIEPFVYTPDGATTAAQSIGHLRGVLDGLSTGASAPARH
ncbi:MAG: sugar phosphate isomerase/epimerase [Pararhodobacter sp.]|nr:sugar phosphate isomerase/epimerase [Pararhodobacter sp.]